MSKQNYEPTNNDIKPSKKSPLPPGSRPLTVQSWDAEGDENLEPPSMPIVVPTHSDWQVVSDAPEKFSKKIKLFCRINYPHAKIKSHVQGDNVNFACCGVFDIQFRVQSYSFNALDTLLISNIQALPFGSENVPLLKLFRCIVNAQKDIGYFYIGLQPALDSWQRKLIALFPFEEQAQRDLWIISIEALKNKITAIDKI